MRNAELRSRLSADARQMASGSGSAGCRAARYDCLTSLQFANRMRRVPRRSQPKAGSAIVIACDDERGQPTLPQSVRGAGVVEEDDGDADAVAFDAVIRPTRGTAGITKTAEGDRARRRAARTHRARRQGSHGDRSARAE